tara:strand:- start:1039 stop:1644 length:606 start_codon:yes stop_codon:yes gene_type:complete
MLIMRIFILLLLFTTVNAAFQLDSSCLKRPQSCDNDAFSTADFTVCDGNYPIKENALSGSGYKSDVNRTCPGGITEWCVNFGPGDEIENATWRNQTGQRDGPIIGCEKLVWLNHSGVNYSAADLELKKEACRKFMSENAAKCEPNPYFWLILILLLVGGVVGLVVYYLLTHDTGGISDRIKNLFKRKRNLVRKPRVFDDGI